MKKTYINPTIEVVRIATQQMLATSDGTPQTSNEVVRDGDPVFGRDFDFDDEDEY